MAAIEQGQLRISGIPCDSPPFRLQISQGFNRHGRMTAGLWIPEETRKELHLNMQVILELDGGGPVFCGVVERATAGKEKGQDCVYLEARTGSCLLDRKKRKRSFQRQGRSYKELARLRPRTRDTLCGKPGREGKRSAVSCSSMRKQTGNSSAGRYPQAGTGSCRNPVFPETGSISACRTASARWKYNQTITV